MDVPHLVKAAALALTLALGAVARPGSAPAQDRSAAGGEATGETGPDRYTLEDVAFMSGCWEGPFESGGRRGTIEEHYTAPSANLVLGTTRYLVDQVAVSFEFSELRADGSGVWLRPYPGGTPSEHAFRLARVREGEALFEAPEHDFPKRILYRSESDGSLSAMIDGGEGSDERSEWRMSRAACPR